jgi:hypothetical protein
VKIVGTRTNFDMARALEKALGRLEATFPDRQEMRGDINKVQELIEDFT